MLSAVLVVAPLLTLPAEPIPASAGETCFDGLCLVSGLFPTEFDLAQFTGWVELRASEQALIARSG